MNSTSLANPQTLNLYAYCGNDPINHLDPSGLFWGKLFKWISKALKWIGIAVLVAVVIMSGPFAPASGTVLAHILGFLVHLGAIIGSAMNFLAGGVILGEGATAASAAILGASGLLLASNAVGAVAKHQARKRRGQDKRKKEPIVAIILNPATMEELAKLTQKQLDKYNKEAKAYKACVDHEWDIFNENVEKVRKAAEETFEKNKPPLWTEWLAGIASGMGGEDKKPEDKLLEHIPDVFNYNQMIDAIERGTKRTAAARDEAIQHNCKEPALP